MCRFISAAKGTPLEITNPNSNDSEEGNYTSSVGGTTSGTICGIFFLLFGAMLLKLAFYIWDYPTAPISIWLLSLSIGLIAFLLIFQGVAFLLTGNVWSQHPLIAVAKMYAFIRLL
jgi:hypothetical protein